MRIAMLGDIALIGEWNIQTIQWKERLAELKRTLTEYDYIIANLESPLTEKKKSFITKSMHLRSSRENIKILKYLGVSAVSLANNHILDFGKQGLRETMDILDKEHIAWYGINGKALHIRKGNERICISGFCCYSTNLITKIGNYKINILSWNNVFDQLKIDRKNGEYSIVSLHWGMEHVHYPAMAHIKLAEKMLDFKSCTIHGHHPHVLQGIQERKNGIIAYSLGNCLFDDAVSLNKKIVAKQFEENKESIVVAITIKNGCLEDFHYKGFKEIISGIKEDEKVEQKVKTYSARLNLINKSDEYEKKRMICFRKSIQLKFSKGNRFKWIISRISYHSLGARILRTKNEYCYRTNFE